MTEFAPCPAFGIECQYVAEVDRLITENDRLREALRDVLVYAPDFMHGMTKDHYEKIAIGSSDD